MEQAANNCENLNVSFFNADLREKSNLTSPPHLEKSV